MINLFEYQNKVPDPLLWRVGGFWTGYGIIVRGVIILYRAVYPIEARRFISYSQVG